MIEFRLRYKKKKKMINIHKILSLYYKEENN